MTNSNWKNYLVIIFFGLLVVLGSISGIWNNWETSIYDNWFNLRGEQDPGKKIALILMDEQSVTDLGPLPWPRSLHAGILERLSLAKVVAFDIVFDQETDPQADQAFVRALQNHGRTVVAAMMTFENDPDDPQPYQVMKTPIDSIAESVAGMGYINMDADKGNIVRSMIPADVNLMKNFPIPSFSLAVAAVASGTDPADIKIQDGILQSGQIELNLNANHRTFIDFWGPGRTFDTFSYADVLNGKYSPDVFKDRIVMIGPFSPTERSSSSGDYYDNPFSKGNLVLSGRICPGVEIHASAVQTFLTGREFVPVPKAVNVLLLVAVWVLIAVVARSRSPWMALWLAFLLAAGVSGLVYGLWLQKHYWLELGAPLIMIGTVYTGATVENIVRTEMERRRTREMFSRYVSPAVVEEVMKSQKEINLGGAKQDLTVMFADIRGFTAYSEHKDPEYVISRLNEYLTEMTRAVLEHGGTLDKYLGDGLMAFFGAPIACEDHADRAILAAINMQERVARLNAMWQEKGEVPLRVAAGINSGPAVVGNVGSLERMDYTIIGEDVNLASRMEALSKLFETLIVISERSHNMIIDPALKNRMYNLGSQLVKGFTEPISCYSVSGMELHFKNSKDQGYK